MQTHNSPLDLIFLGTGSSASVPNIRCLTATPEEKPCHTCLSTLTPEGKRNIRRNTSAVVRIDGQDKKVTIVIDVGKNFQAAAVEWFPKYGLRQIDAVLITHAHADALNGLDDLRSWTLASAIQPFVDLYVSQTTFDEINRAFPYLIVREYASGGGSVPEFRWHIIDDKVSFEIGDTGVRVLPFGVHHGRIFGTAPLSGVAQTPASTMPSTPTKPKGNATNGLDGLEGQIEKICPYICYGFKIQDSLIYISDVSHVPDDVWTVLEQERESTRRYPVLVLDCLRLGKHTSHFGVNDSVTTARRIGARRTYFTGFDHDLSNEEYETIFKVANGGKKEAGPLNANEQLGISMIDKGEAMWMRPAFDGLRVRVSGDGTVCDEGYI